MQGDYVALDLLKDTYINAGDIEVALLVDLETEWILKQCVLARSSDDLNWVCIFQINARNGS